MSEERELRAQELREEAALRADRGDNIKVAAESVLAKRKWKKALAAELVMGWHADSHIWAVVNRAWAAVGKEPKDAIEKFGVPAEMMGVKYVYAADRTQPFIARHFPALNEALWAGRKTEMCVLIAERALGIKKGTGVPLYKSARTEDKRHDWATVK